MYKTSDNGNIILSTDKDNVTHAELREFVREQRKQFRLHRTNYKDYRKEKWKV